MVMYYFFPEQCTTHTQVMSAKNTSVCLQCQLQTQLVKHHLLFENGNPSNFESLL